MKFEVKYGRTVQVVPYESLKIEMTAEYQEPTSPDEGFLQVKAYVDKWIENNVSRLRGNG